MSKIRNPRSRFVVKSPRPILARCEKCGFSGIDAAKELKIKLRLHGECPNCTVRVPNGTVSAGTT